MKMITRVGVSVAFGLVVLCSAAAIAQSDPHNGSWVLNVEKSTYAAGMAPKSQTTTYTVTAQAIKMLSSVVNAAGKPVDTEFSVPFDGTDAPVKGNPDYDATSAKRIDASTIEFTRKRAGKVVQTARSTVAKDGKTRTVTVTGVNAQGQKVNTTATYIKK